MDLKSVKVEALNLNDSISAVFYLLLTLITLYFGFYGERKSWLKFMIFRSGLEGVTWLFTPSFIFDLFNEGESSLDGVHLHLGRVLGVCALFYTLLFYLYQEAHAHDQTIFPTLIWTQAVTWALIIMVFAHRVFLNSTASFDDISKVDLFECLTLLLISMSLLACFAQMHRLESWGGYVETFSWSNFHIRVDYLGCLLLGISVMAFPKWLYQSQVTVALEETHLDMLRMIGALLIGGSVISGRATNFLRPQDKVTLFTAKIAMSSLLLVVHIVGHLWYKLFTSAHVFIFVFGALFCIVNSVRGYTAAFSEWKKTKTL